MASFGRSVAERRILRLNRARRAGPAARGAACRPARRVGVLVIDAQLHAVRPTAGGTCVPIVGRSHRRTAVATPSPPLGAERAGVRWGIPERLPTPTSPSHAFGAGPSLSPLKGEEG